MSCCSHGLVKPKPKPRPPKIIPIQFGFLEPPKKKAPCLTFRVGLLYVRMEGWKEGREEGLPWGHRTDPDPSQSGKKRRIVMKGRGWTGATYGLLVQSPFYDSSS